MSGGLNNHERLTLRARLWRVPRWAALLSVGIVTIYLSTMALTSGVRGDQLLPCAMILAVAFWSDRTRDFFVRTLPYTIYGIVYDFTHITEPLVQKLHVHVAEPYRFELAHFAVATAAGRMTLNQYFALHHWLIVDFFTGTAYLVFIYWAIGFGFYLVWTGRSGERRALATGFGLAFLAMNLVGFATYYIYPAAPPWYVTSFGLGPANFAAQPSPAAAIRWDQLTGLHYFQSFYAKSADIFGAMPSLHCAQPLLVFLYGRHLRKPWLNWVQGPYYLLVCFSAIYLQHHYVLDVLAGSAFALTAYAVERLVTKSLGLKRHGSPWRTSGALRIPASTRTTLSPPPAEAK